MLVSLSGVVQSTRTAERPSDNAWRTQLDIYCNYRHNRLECSLTRSVVCYVRLHNILSSKDQTCICCVTYDFSALTECRLNIKKGIWYLTNLDLAVPKVSPRTQPMVNVENRAVI